MLLTISFVYQSFNLASFCWFKFRVYKHTDQSQFIYVLPTWLITYVASNTLNEINPAPYKPEMGFHKCV